MKAPFITAVLALTAFGACAQAGPTGLWKTIDDDGKTEKSLVRIAESGGVYTGTIEKIFDASKATGVCDKCSDDRKDKPLIGLQVIRGVTANAKDKALWDGGQILDPKDGKTYKVRLTPVEAGKKLEVRGYMGMPMLGRTQVWHRVE